MRPKFLPGLTALTLLVAFTAGAADTAKTTLTITGMTCGGCAVAVKVQLKKTTGVTACEVSYEKGEAEVTYDPARTDPKKIAESVSKTGFQATVKGEKKNISFAPGGFSRAPAAQRHGRG